MEAKLAEYRAKKAKDYASVKSNSDQTFNWLFKRTAGQTCGQGVAMKPPEDDHSNPLGSANSSDSENSPLVRTVISEPVDNVPLEDNPCKKWDAISVADMSLKIVLWLTLWAMFTHLEFGAPFFVISLMYIMYRSLRTGPKQNNHLSAYSVFNKNCERIDGTLTAEQFEQEIRYGPSSVK